MLLLIAMFGGLGIICMAFIWISLVFKNCMAHLILDSIKNKVTAAKHCIFCVESRWLILNSLKQFGKMLSIISFTYNSDDCVLV